MCIGQKRSLILAHFSERKMEKQLFGASCSRTFAPRSKNRSATPLAQRGRLNVPSKGRRRVKRGFDAIFGDPSLDSETSAEKLNTSEDKENLSKRESDKENLSGNRKMSKKRLAKAIEAFSVSSSSEDEEPQLVLPRKRNISGLAQRKIFTEAKQSCPSSTPCHAGSKKV